MKKYVYLIILCCIYTYCRAQNNDTVTNKINNVPYRRFNVFTKFTQGNIYDYIAKNISYPASLTKNINGRIVTSMVIDEEGKVTDITVFQNLSPAIDSEILRVLSGMPKWIPAQLNGNPVKLNIVLLTAISADATAKTIRASKYNYPSSPQPNENTIFNAVQEPPTYPNGETTFHQYLDKNIVYPSSDLKNKSEGKVYMSFVIEKDGTLTDIKAIRSPSQEITNECLRVLKDYKFIPGKQNGKTVRVAYMIAINFNLNEPTKH